MDFLIVTGLSGAGKSRAVDAMEDIGIFCVDNVPPVLIPTFVDLFTAHPQEYRRVAIVTDIRSGKRSAELYDTLRGLTAQQVPLRILFLDADDFTLEKRYRETRRRHPLQEECGGNLHKAISMERELLAPVRAIADLIVDTTSLAPIRLQERINELLLGGAQKGLRIYCTSFGFKYGGLLGADLLFDVRCLPNPYYIPALRDLTGRDAPVRDYVMQNPRAQGFCSRLYGMLDYMIPLYLEEGKCQLTVAFGCTGGKHRSVTFAEETGKYLLERGYTVEISHRDIERN